MVRAYSLTAGAYCTEATITLKFELAQDQIRSEQISYDGETGDGEFSSTTNDDKSDLCFKSFE